MCLRIQQLSLVALLTEGVDRNMNGVYDMIALPVVALLTEGVDRNKSQ